MIRSGHTKVSLQRGLIKGKKGKKIIYFKKDGKTYEIPNLIAGQINRNKNKTKKQKPPTPSQNTTIKKKKP